MQLEGIDHVALGVRDIDQSVKWYTEVLGFERLHQDMWDGVPTFIGKGNTGIALFPASPNAKPTSPSHRELRMLHLAFRADRGNFLAAQRELEKRGIDFEFHEPFDFTQDKRSRDISRHIEIIRDLIRSLPVRSAFGLPVYVAASPAVSFSTSLGMTG